MNNKGLNLLIAFCLVAFAIIGILILRLRCHRSNRDHGNGTSLQENPFRLLLISNLPADLRRLLETTGLPYVEGEDAQEILVSRAIKILKPDKKTAGISQPSNSAVIVAGAILETRIIHLESKLKELGESALSENAVYGVVIRALGVIFGIIAVVGALFFGFAKFFFS